MLVCGRPGKGDDRRNVRTRYAVGAPDFHERAPLVINAAAARRHTIVHCLCSLIEKGSIGVTISATWKAPVEVVADVAAAAPAWALAEWARSNGVANLRGFGAILGCSLMS
jgi:hypothetical protein